ncbi:MAG TPA: excinuclease ABC subunit UvrC, partial [Longimicrobiales bacterium]|nr:excinuclease ABC subunit UvrC [Longimicrobiales bacterium]
MKNDELQKRIEALPARPGVYMFKDAKGDIIYVGKAKSLRARVKGHFSNDAPAAHNLEVIRRARDVDTIVVASEAEALLLEANLIKSHQPRFNIRLKDDKKYPYIRVTVQERFPRVYVTRSLVNDGAKYFGPYTNVGDMRLALEVIKRLYTVRSCRYDLPIETPARPCLDYHIGRCLAPCVGLQTNDQYREMTDEILDVLGGNVDNVRSRVSTEMRDAAEKMEFERAANLRDVLNGLVSIERRQRAIDIRGGDVDVIGTARDGDRGVAVLLRIREGKLLGRELDFFENVLDETDASLLEAAATRFYFGRGDYGMTDLPKEVLFPLEFEDRPTIEGLLTEQSKRKIDTHVPQKGDKLRLIELASQNARHLLEERIVLDESVRDRADDTLYEVQEALELKVVPRVIVCFDISHLQGSEVVGSGVVFVNGEPRKSEYRRFRIRGDWGNDDFRSMAEIVGRYFKRRIDEQLPIPDLAVIDGGRGQLGAALAAAMSVGAPDVAFIGLAKKEEEIYLARRLEPLRLPRTSPALRMLQRVRNEAHRFAHSYNSKLRTKRTLRSELGDIPGIGPSRQ